MLANVTALLTTAPCLLNFKSIHGTLYEPCSFCPQLPHRPLSPFSPVFASESFLILLGYAQNAACSGKALSHYPLLSFQVEILGFPVSLISRMLLVIFPWMGLPNLPSPGQDPVPKPPRPPQNDASVKHKGRIKGYLKTQTPHFRFGLAESMAKCLREAWQVCCKSWPSKEAQLVCGKSCLETDKLSSLSL